MMLFQRGVPGGGSGVAPELLRWAGFGEAAPAVHVHQNLDRFST
jgi:hypothetical protein